mmetsp:Transcript_14390/g.42321  ORF Transcript_14390/g.42321 Transcript_14390/m.42321 type:complete len:212 (-) Transcript_14390:5051-5686(-)
MRLRVLEEGPVRLPVLSYLGGQLTEGGQLRHRQDRLPELVIQPGLRVAWRLVGVEQHAAGEQLTPLVCIQPVVPHQQRRAKQHREGELVPFEQRAANVAVQKVLEEAVEVLQPHGQVGGWLRVGDRTHKEVDEPLERVLVHGVDVRERGDAEKEQRRAVRHRLVPSARLVNLDLGLLSHLLLLRDLVPERLCGGEDVDGGGVLQDRASLAR